MKTRLALFAAVAAFVVGCGSSGVYLSREELDRLPHESRQEIFDAENDLVIARDRHDDAIEHKEEAVRSLAELDQRLKRATARLSSAGQGARADQVRQVFDKHRAYLNAIVDVASAGVDRTEAETRLSLARLQLVRARQLARVGRGAAASLKPLEDDVSDLDKRMKAKASSETELRAKAQAQLKDWKQSEDSYARASGDYDTGIWGD
jgi:hypothetical protein